MVVDQFGEELLQRVRFRDHGLCSSPWAATSPIGYIDASF